jgi:2-keto-4-pentenoate hydratase
MVWGELMDAQSIQGAAARLWNLWSNDEFIPELPRDLRPMDLDEGWDVQRALDALAGPRIGWKIASTTVRFQKLMGITGPLVGALYECQLLPNRSTVRPTSLAMVEGEFAFRMRGDLEPDRAPFTREAVLARVGSVHAGLDVPDYRLATFGQTPHVSIPQMVADFMASRYFVEGDALDVMPYMLRDIEVVAHRNQIEESRGRGSDVLGDPLEALVWLANELAKRGERIRDGDLITTGACAVVMNMAAGDSVSATFAHNDEVGISFGPL